MVAVCMVLCCVFISPLCCRYVVFVSGLNVGSAHCDQLALQLMVDYLSGCLGGVEDQARMRKVVRVIVAGNSITNKPVESSVQLEKKKKKVRKRSSHGGGAGWVLVPLVFCSGQFLVCDTLLVCLEVHFSLSLSLSLSHTHTHH